MTNPICRPCPDCGQATETTGPPLVPEHDRTCPIGRGLQAAMVDDRDYFAAHPGAAVRERAITWAERVQQVALGTRPELLDGARVIVREVVPGFRLRAIVPAGRRRR